MNLTAITGGIGSGKSVVSRILRILGYPVYDCDSRARTIMDADIEIQRRIADEVCREAISESGIDRRRLASAVFADRLMLERLNSIVHNAVKEDLKLWAASQKRQPFVETAILYESGIDRMVDKVWNVYAPREIRLSRGMTRDNACADGVEARIAAQEAFRPDRIHPRTFTIINDGVHPVIPQILKLIATA